MRSEPQIPRTQDCPCSNIYTVQVTSCEPQTRSAGELVARTHRTTHSTKRRKRSEPQAHPAGSFVARAHRTTPRRKFTKNRTRCEPQTHTKDKTNKKENEKQRSTNPCVRQTEAEHRKTIKKNRHNSTTIKSVNVTERPTPCGQTPGKK